MNESHIIHQLSHYFATADYCLGNVFIYEWESDFFCITSSGYAMEVEVKISRGDFRADMKKTQKHFILTHADRDLVTMPLDSRYEIAPDIMCPIGIVKPIAPNKFFYCCPEGMIKPEELPEYAGLLYCHDLNSDLMTVHQEKSAKWLHKKKHDLSKELLSKYFHLYQDLRYEYALLKRKAEWMQNAYKSQIELEVKDKHLNRPKFFEPKLFPDD